MRSAIIAIICCCSYLNTVYSQPAAAAIRFMHAGIENGLSHNQVNVIYKDEDGFVWVGTQEGLNRYDGYAFTIYRHRQNDTLSLQDDMITGLYGGPEHTLWVYTVAGLQVMNSRTRCFYAGTDSLLRAWQLPAGVKAVVRAGDAWCFIYPQQVYIRKAGKVTAYTPQEAAVKGTVIDGAAVDKENQLWLVYHNGRIQRVDVGAAKLLHTSPALPARPQNAIGYSLYTDNAMHCWLYCMGDNTGLLEYIPATQKSRLYNTRSSNSPISSDLVTGVTENEGYIWISTDHGGVNIVNRRTGVVQVLTSQEGDIHSLAQNSITCLYKDDNGIVWVGTYKNGFCYYKKGALPFSLYRYNPLTRTGLPFNDVNNFVEDPKGNIWIATNGSGLLYFNRAEESFQTFRRAQGLSADVVVGLCRDAAGRLWAGTYMGGLNRITPQGIQHFTHAAGDSTTLCDNRVFTVFEDSRRRLWIGTMAGLDCYSEASGHFVHYGNYLQQQVGEQYVSCVAESSTGEIWVGTTKGIAIFNPGTQQWRTLTVANSALVFNDIHDIYRDAKGNMWIATRGGVSMISQDAQRFTNITTRDGLPDNAVVKILGDSEGRMWMSTVRGLARVTCVPDDKGWTPQVTVYDAGDGLQSTAFNKYAAMRARSGELFFGGPGGFNVIDPVAVRTGYETVPVAVTGITATDRKGNLEANPAWQSAVALPYRQNTVTLSFSALAYGNPAHYRYRYRLAGLQQEWMEPLDKGRSVSFASLEPGTYVFEVMAAGNDGAWSKVPARVQLTILPPFWRTGWAYLLYVMVGIAVLVMARSYIIRRTRARMSLAAARRDADRVRQLNEMKIKFFTNISHELRTPISLILSPLEHLLQQTDKKMQQAQVEMMQRNARRLLHLVNQLLDFRKMELSELHLHLVEENIIPFLESTVNSFLDLSVQKHIRLCFHTTQPQLVMAFDRDKVERILFNLLSNAFKFTAAGGTIEVVVSVVAGDGGNCLQIAVKDNGIGISTAAQQHIFAPFYQAGLPAGMVNQGAGIGLSISKEFMHLHGGDIQLQSQPGQGSCFTLQFPVKVREAELPVVIAEEKEEAEPATPTQKPARARVTVLLVEDNEDFRFYLKDNLMSHYEVIVADNGKTGWQKALQVHPDIIISDISMPVMDGITLCRKLKADERTAGIPVLLMTALTNEEFQLKGWDTGADGYLVKPFSCEVLHSRIRNLLEQQVRMQKKWQKQVTAVPAAIAVETPDEKLVREALELIENHIGDASFSVEELSRGLRMSRVGLYKRLYSLTGKAPLDFIRSVRVQRAAMLLEKTDKTIAEIAYEVGFNDPKYFSRYFKSVYQLTPSGYMAQFRKGGVGSVELEVGS
ncbi:signal transduction histidine kinase/ligand-binding sensor domain-containing protein/AraC-like DNA-binding protein [Filimonas zeae]|nr:two-component regulator propeller domain-containing protein [Filimonas zeae]MDR6340623.1 signal transduction histidine kinase/ligand-binding sensor domain-containing protein/AraC-like DNA-binding protein [Filimonas zeae]